MAITLRNTKGSALTYTELDGNFTDLDGRIFDSNAVRTLIDSDYVQLRQADIFRDSGFVTGIVDSDYVQLRVPGSYLESIVDSDYVQARQVDVFRDSGFVTNIVDSDYINTRVDAVEYTGFDSDFNTKSTSDLTEGTNLYYTDARFDTRLGSKTTDNVSEGSTNLYYTTLRFDSDFTDNNTDNLSEGTSNLYYTQGRVDSDITFLVDSSYVSLRSGTTTDISGDTSPELGGNLDVNSNTIEYRFNLTASGTDHYVFSDSGNNWFPTSENDPTLYLRRGETYRFSNLAGAHPFQIQDSQNGVAYNTGVTNNNTIGDVIFTPAMSAPTTLWYQCTAHANMGGTINIV